MTTPDLTADRDESFALSERIAALPDELQVALQGVLDAADRIAADPASGDALRRLVHAVFEDSVMEFFGSAPASTQLPARYVDRCAPDPEAIPLPAPAAELPASLGETLECRASRRSFGNRPLSLDELSTWLAWALGARGTEAGYGVSGLPLFRFPTIGGLCGLRFDVIANRVDGLAQGRYTYDPVGHALRLVERGDHRAALVELSFESEWLFFAPVVTACIVDQGRTAWKYKTRSYRYAHVDVGAAVQTMSLVATALELDACPVAAFFDTEANRIFDLDTAQEYLALLFPLGHGPEFGHQGR